MDIPVPALRAATSALRVTPTPVANMVARGVGAGIAGFSRDERTIAARNLRRAGVELPNPVTRRLAVQRVFDSYSRYWVDTLRLPNLGTGTIARSFSAEGYEHIEQAYARGSAPILALPHLGGWEMAARWLVSVKGRNVAAVVEEIEPPELFDWFLEVRRGLGMNIIPLSAGASGAAAALAAGQILCLLCDRDISGGGIEVEFFGETTRLPGGPALIAVRTGAPLLPSAVYFRGSGCHAIIDEPIETTRRGRLREDVTRITQDLAHALERHIRRAPHQWHLLQPNWPSDYEALGRDRPDGADAGDR